MKTIRKPLLLSLLLFLCCINDIEAQVQPAAYAGPQLRSALYKVRDEKQATDSKPGFMAGGALKVMFDNQFYFFPSIYYSLRGYKVVLKDSAYPPTQFAVNNDVSIHSITFAPLFQVDLTKRPSHPFIRFGPAVDINVAGKEKFDTVSLSGNRATVTRDMPFSFADYGRVTASLVIHAGYEGKKGLMLSAYHEYGVGSLNNADYGPRVFHRIYGLSLGWRFGQIGKY